MAAPIIAPGKPGIVPRWTSSAKIGVGTSLSSDSNVWFTISHGIINEVYYPRIDIANIRDFGLIVTDGKEFFSEEKRSAVHDYVTIFEGVPAYHLTNTCQEGRYKIEKKVITDPRRNVLLQQIQFIPMKGMLSDYKIFCVIAPHILNAGYHNTGWTGNYKGIPMLFAKRESICLAVACDTPFIKMSAGYVGASDGWQTLHQHKSLTETYERAEDGNVALTGEIDLNASQGFFTLALSFGIRQEEAGIQARASLARGFDAALEEFTQGWRQDESKMLNLSHVDPEGGSNFRISNVVLKTHQGKHFSGSLIASLSIPWGNSKEDTDLGGYHLIWPRDQVETAEAFLAMNDYESARQILLFLIATQEEDGHWPQNMWEDGGSYWAKIQLDETALPILLVSHLKRLDYLKRVDYLPVVLKAASYLIKKGPITEQDRWEETHGFAPFTLSVVISALLAAAELIEKEGMEGEAAYLRDAADWWHDSIDRWLWVENTPLTKRLSIPGTYIRANPSCTVEEDPHKVMIRIDNRPPDQSLYPAHSIISTDPLAFVRYGLREASDPRILSTIQAIDDLLKTETSRGPVWHRYNEDGYGEKADGSPFDGTGIGRGWPLLTGERAHYEIAAGRIDEATRLLRVMRSMTGVGGMFPEQVWDCPDISAKSLFKGHSTGSAKPLVWTHAEYIRLLRSLQDGKIFSTPSCTSLRYLQNKTSSRVALWQLTAQFPTLPRGKNLRIQLLKPAVLHWTVNRWQTKQETPLSKNALGIYYADLPVSHLTPGDEVEWTVFWVQDNVWDGKNDKVTVG